MKTQETANSNARQSKIIDGFDRVRIRLDRPELPFSTSTLKSHCSQVVLSMRSPRYQPHSKLLVDLHQPTLQGLKLLLCNLGREFCAHITYVEVARDVVVLNDAVTELATAFLQSAYPLSQRQLAIPYKTTWYWGRRCDTFSNRRSNVVVMYADKPSKLKNARPENHAAPCFHVEWRLTGAAALASSGIGSLEDLVHFDHENFWASKLRLYRLPNKTQLGRLISETQNEKGRVSDTAYYKRAVKWMDEHRVNKYFILHNALKNTPGVLRKLPTMSFEKWVDASIKTTTSY